MAKRPKYNPTSEIALRTDLQVMLDSTMDGEGETVDVTVDPTGLATVTIAATDLRALLDLARRAVEANITQLMVDCD